MYQNGEKYVYKIVTKLPKWPKNIPNAVNYTKWPLTIPNGPKYQPFPFQGPPKFTQIVFWFENIGTIWQPCLKKGKLICSI
jgi:hypothetical protein